MNPVAIINRDQLRTAAGIGISLLLHALLLLLLRTQMPRPPESSGSESRTPLVVELNRQPQGRETAPPPVAQAPASQPPPARPPVAVKPRPDRPVARKPTPVAPRAPLPRRPVETPRAFPEPPPLARSEPAADMSEMVEAARARRRAAGIASPDDAPREQDARPQGDEVARANIERSLAQARGSRGAGGVFQVTRKGAREGAFLFRGWDNDSRAGLRELIEVDAGPNGNVEDAIVRKMIELIRKYYPGDFSWNSRRLGRVVTLSARRQDNAGLEEFLKKEFF